MSISKPFTFTAGTKARANEVNQNFDVVYSEVNSIDSTLTSLSVDIQSLQEDKANINGSASQRFQAAPGVNSYDVATISQLKANNPVGSLIMVAYDSVPDGYLKCDGSTISRSTYSSLFDVIGVEYGEGDGSNTFQLPDFQDRVPWGKSSDDVLGYIEAGLPNIEATLTAGNGSGGFNGGTGAFYSITGGVSYSEKWYGSHVGTASFSASKSNSIYGGSKTVQPPAVKVNICIKY